MLNRRRSENVFILDYYPVKKKSGGAKNLRTSFLPWDPRRERVPNSGVYRHLPLPLSPDETGQHCCS